MLSAAEYLIPSGETRAQKWLLRHCGRKHSKCRPPETSPPPTRLIDIRKYPEVRLVQGSSVNAEKDRRYVALSYCWGSSMPNGGKTTSTSLVANLASVDVSQLPKTMQDVIELTHRLSVPFLWIDALCIVQDDPSDWKREAATMSSVYSGAFVTVAAATSDNCNSGFLQNPHPERVIKGPKRHSVQHFNRIGDPFMYTYESKMLEFARMWLDSFRANPLLLRGWTLQERELSPRILHFMGNFVLWECRELVSVYIRPQKSWVLREPFLWAAYRHPSIVWPYRCLDVQNKKGGWHPGSFTTMVMFAGSEPISFETWQDMVENYTRRALTVPTDKIAGIAGVADAMQKTFKCNYLAGLWRDNLLQDLLWWRADGDTVHGEMDRLACNIPSWSWAWTNFPITFYREPRKHASTAVAEVVDAVGPENATGEGATQAFIRLRAKVSKVTIRCGATFTLDTGYIYLAHHERTEYLRVGALALEAGTVNLYDSETNRQRYPDSALDTLTICILKTHIEYGGIGLVLSLVEREPPTYQRLGVMENIPLCYYKSVEVQELTLI